MNAPMHQGIQLKLDRADQHIRDFVDVTEPFLEGCSEQAIPEDESKRRMRYVARIVGQPDPRWGLIVGDAIHNLRSALDHLAVALVGTYPPDDKTGFPFTKYPNEYEAKLARKVPCASQAAMHKLRSLEPYPGGDQALWGLYRLDIVDKHHVLLPVVSAVRADERTWVDTRPDAGFDDTELRSLPAIRYPVEDGTVLDSIPKIPHVYVSTKFSFHVAFGEGSEGFDGQSIRDTLNDFRKRVGEVISDLEPFL